VWVSAACCYCRVMSPDYNSHTDRVYDKMSLVSLLILVLVLAVILYLISILPIDARFKNIAQIVVILIAVIWLLQLLFGFIPLGSTRIG